MLRIPLSFIFYSGFIYETTKSTQGTPLHRLFTSEELKNATSNFDVSTLIGEGSNGKVPSEHYNVLCDSCSTERIASQEN